MFNRYSPYRRGGIRFFPHIFPIAFPLIFPFGIGLVFGLFHLLLPLIAIVFFAALIFFIVRLVTQGSAGAVWNSMKGTGSQWQRFTAQQPYYQPQQPYYQPSAPTGQEQPAQPYGQGYQPQQPYYQPSAPTGQGASSEQLQAHYPEQMPPIEQS